MHCPFCNEHDTKVIDSRLVADGQQTRRRRECQACGERFTTFETAELVMPRIIKTDGKREPFHEEKMVAGIYRALEKRPVSVDDVEQAVNRIKQQLRTTGEREVDSRVLGEFVMNELRQLDQVAYVRFASVYRSFQDLDEFRREIERISLQVKEQTQGVEALVESLPEQATFSPPNDDAGPVDDQPSPFETHLARKL